MIFEAWVLLEKQMCHCLKLELNTYSREKFSEQLLSESSGNCLARVSVVLVHTL